MHKYVHVTCYSIICTNCSTWNTFGNKQASNLWQMRDNQQNMITVLTLKVFSCLHWMPGYFSWIVCVSLICQQIIYCICEVMDILYRNVCSSAEVICLFSFQMHVAGYRSNIVCCRELILLSPSWQSMEILFFFFLGGMFNLWLSS